MTAALPIVWHPDYVAPLNPRHRFPMSKYGALRPMLEARGLMPPGGFVAPAEAPVALLQAVHPPDYVDRVLTSTLTEAEVRRIGLPSTPRVARRGRLACAGTLLAARFAMDRGVGLTCAGGSHHAGPDGGAGFCVFNDVAVAARALLDEGRVARILVVDCDVHQGDGTARAFEGEPGVFTLSIHAERNYPARKAVSDMDVPLPDGTGDAAYLAALEGALDVALDTGPFDLAFYNAGVDPWEGDRLGRLALSMDGLAARDRSVLARLRDAGIPVAAALGGGYGESPEEVAGRHALLFDAAAAVFA